MMDSAVQDTASTTAPPPEDNHRPTLQEGVDARMDIDLRVVPTAGFLPDTGAAEEIHPHSDTETHVRKQRSLRKHKRRRRAPSDECLQRSSDVDCGHSDDGTGGTEAAVTSNSTVRRGDGFSPLTPQNSRIHQVRAPEHVAEGRCTTFTGCRAPLSSLYIQTTCGLTAQFSRAPSSRSSSRRTITTTTDKMKCLIVLSAAVAVALAKPGYLGAGVAAPAVAAVPGIAAAVQPAPVYVGGIHPGLAAYGPANIVVGPGGYNLDTPDVAAARGAHLKTVSAIKRTSADPDVGTGRPRPVGTRRKDGCGTFTCQRPTHCKPPVYKLVFCCADVHCSSADSSRQQQTLTTDTMKCLIVLSAVLAMAFAKPGYLGAGVVAPAVAAAPGIAAAVQPAPVLVGGIHPGLAAYGPANIVVGPGGYNLDTPDVAAARGAHLTAVAQTRARDAAINGAALAAASAAAYGAYAAPAVVAAPAVAAVAPAAYAAPSAALLAAKAAYHG
ncbi:mRNA decay activator protein ZFP36L3-like [Schistocerca cancellata]|uniref:mRNA decay activator protein ZFP36L3-like n=1 Tax=Schistocerca cancellata TaxID=274614 RepID=UPI002118DFF6|nr:mRNA decay activator protein ZFP36L3-like [Schistocerca cancellata]